MRIIAALTLLAASLSSHTVQSPGGTQSPAASGGTLLVSLSGDAQVALIDATTYQTIVMLPVDPGPHEIAVSRDARTAYVAISGTGPGGTPGKSVAVIDLRARSVRAFSEAICRQPHDVRVSRDAKLLWVACGPDQAVLELNARTGKLLRTLKTNVDGGWFVEASRNERRLFVPHLEGKSLTVIDRRDAATRNIPFAGAMAGIAIAPDGREVWAGYDDNGRAKIAVLDAAGTKVIATIDTGVAAFPRMQFTPGGQRVVAVLGRTCVIVDVAGRAITSRIELPAAAKVVAIDGSGSRAFLTSPGSNQVFVIDVTSARLLTSFPVGKQPDSIAWVK